MLNCSSITEVVMPMKMLIKTTVNLLLFLVLSFPAQADLSGTATVIDGDTIDIGGVVVTLWGIDAPEPDQTCTIKTKVWPCGAEATVHLRTFIGKTPVTCIQKNKNDDQGIIAKCASGTLDLGAEMVEVGLALPYTVTSGRYYLPSYREARGLSRGIHAGSFENPWDWVR